MLGCSYYIKSWFGHIPCLKAFFDLIASLKLTFTSSHAQRYSRAIKNMGGDDDEMLRPTCRWARSFFLSPQHRIHPAPRVAHNSISASPRCLRKTWNFFRHVESNLPVQRRGQMRVHQFLIFAAWINASSRARGFLVWRARRTDGREREICKGQNATPQRPTLAVCTHSGWLRLTPDENKLVEPLCSQMQSRQKRLEACSNSIMNGSSRLIVETMLLRDFISQPARPARRVMHFYSVYNGSVRENEIIESFAALAAWPFIK